MSALVKTNFGSNTLSARPIRLNRGCKQQAKTLESPFQILLGKINLIMGMSGTMKSTIARWIIKRCLQLGLFGRMMVLCPGGLDRIEKNKPADYEWLENWSPGSVITEPTTEYVQALINRQERDLKKYGKAQPTLLVFDDCYGSEVKFRKDKAIETLTARSRRLMITVLIICHSYMSLDPCFRNSSAVVYIARSPANDLKELYKGTSEFKSYKDFEAVYKRYVHDTVGNFIRLSRVPGEPEFKIIKNVPYPCIIRIVPVETPGHG